MTSGTLRTILIFGAAVAAVTAAACKKPAVFLSGDEQLRSGEQLELPFGPQSPAVTLKTPNPTTIQPS